MLLTSHNMDEVESMCARVAFIQKGRIIKLAAVDELKRLHQTDDLEQIFIELAHHKDVPSPLRGGLGMEDNSQIIFSNDEGKTFTDPKPLQNSLN